jgi:hypothetical protein
MFRNALMASILLMCQGQVNGQASWRFTRTDTNEQDAKSQAVVKITNPLDFDDDVTENTGEVLAAAGASALVSNDVAPGTATALATVAAEATNITPPYAETYAPTVSTSATSIHNVSATLPKTADCFETSTEASSNGTFELSGNVASGFLHCSMYLVGITQETESGVGEFIRDGFIQSKIGPYFVEAGYSDSQGQWAVDVSLPDLTESFFTAGVNHFFTFTIPVSLPTTISISSVSLSPAAGNVIGGDGSATGSVALSASAWMTFTPDNTPLSGDFDGDGDVDGRDFLMWQRGSGTANGATLTDGDANHDGMVDEDDLEIWADSYGTSIAPSTALVPIPEPHTSILTIFIVTGLMARSQHRRRVR